jgi:peptidoglycan/LPS O-acetylase OafA/YrhL
MVNTARAVAADRVALATRLVRVYVVIVLGTIAALAVLSGIDSGQATPEAWGHAVIVGVFAVLLPLRLRSARQGDPRALVAVGIIAGVLAAVNVVEALIPDFLPGWMRIEMIGVAALMVAVGAVVLRGRQ